MSNLIDETKIKLIKEYIKNARVGNTWLIAYLANEYKVTRAEVYRLLAEAEDRKMLPKHIYKEHLKVNIFEER